MGDKPSTFRDFGLLPDDLQPPAGTVRCSLSPSRVVAQYIVTGVIAAVGCGIGWFIHWMLPPPLRYLGLASTALAFSVFIYLGVRRDYRWIELDGETIRAQHLYTGHIITRRVQEIAHLFSIFTVGHHIETAVVNLLLGKVKGMEIRFRDGRTPLRVMRIDPTMTNAEELLQGVIQRMTQLAEIEPEIVTSEDQPLVRSIHWYGEAPPPRESNGTTVTLVVFLVAAVVVGVILGGAGVQQEEIYRVTAVPPHELSLAALIQNGPGNNRHVTVTGFTAGEPYVYEMKSGNSAFLPLFPEDGKPQEIEVVLSVNNVALNRLRQIAAQRRITGICSASESTSWGYTTGPELSERNQLPLRSAWRINEVGIPPSQEFVQGMYQGSYISFGLGIALAAVVLGLKLLRLN